MPARNLSNLATLVRKRRGHGKLRETSKEIGISAATLMRVESGRIPDVATFGKLCKWLELDPASFLGFEGKEENEPKPTMVSAHLKLDSTPKPKTLNALSKMILIAMRMQGVTREIESGEDA
jgi:transcriptional regulator with XRE-family HTH domain